MQKIRTNLIYPIFIPHKGCPFRCVYCNQFKRKSGINPENQESIPLDVVSAFIKKHTSKPKEIAFYGGSFTCMTQEQINKYFKEITPIIDDDTYFRLSTRPEAINDEILNHLKQNRVNTIELGIQSFDDKVLLASKRGYTSQTAINACKLVLQHGFNLCIQFLVGLPEEDRNSINENIRLLLSIKPDYVRLYPLIVIKDTELENIYQNGGYQPLSVEEAVEICRLYLSACNSNNIKVIKIGLHSDISKDDIVAGPYHDRFRELVGN